MSRVFMNIAARRNVLFHARFARGFVRTMFGKAASFETVVSNEIG